MMSRPIDHRLNHYGWYTPFQQLHLHAVSVLDYPDAVGLNMTGQVIPSSSTPLYAPSSATHPSPAESSSQAYGVGTAASLCGLGGIRMAAQQGMALTIQQKKIRSFRMLNERAWVVRADGHKGTTTVHERLPSLQWITTQMQRNGQDQRTASQWQMSYVRSEDNGTSALDNSLTYHVDPPPSSSLSTGPAGYERSLCNLVHPPRISVHLYHVLGIEPRAVFHNSPLSVMGFNIGLKHNHITTEQKNRYWYTTISAAADGATTGLTSSCVRQFKQTPSSQNTNAAPSTTSSTFLSKLSSSLRSFYHSAFPFVNKEAVHGLELYWINDLNDYSFTVGSLYSFLFNPPSTSSSPSSSAASAPPAQFTPSFALSYAFQSYGFLTAALSGKLSEQWSIATRYYQNVANLETSGEIGVKHYWSNHSALHLKYVTSGSHALAIDIHPFKDLTRGILSSLSFSFHVASSSASAGVVPTSATSNTGLLGSVEGWTWARLSRAVTMGFAASIGEW